MWTTTGGGNEEVRHRVICKTASHLWTASTMLALQSNPEALADVV